MMVRKKPVVVEAFPIEAMLNQPDVKEYPVHMIKAIEAGILVLDFNKREAKITTKEGVMTGEERDWIIKGVHGELYPIKPEIFDATYEPIEGEE